MLAPEDLFSTISRQVFNTIGKFLATVISAPRIAFGILVGKHAAKSRQDLWKCVVLRWNQFNADLLALLLTFQCRKNIGVLLFKNG